MSIVYIYQIYFFFGVAIVFGQAYPFKSLIHFCPFAYANSQSPRTEEGPVAVGIWTYTAQGVFLHS